MIIKCVKYVLNTCLIALYLQIPCDSSRISCYYELIRVIRASTHVIQVRKWYDCANPANRGYVERQALLDVLRRDVEVRARGRDASR